MPNLVVFSIKQCCLVLFLVSFNLCYAIGEIVVYKNTAPDKYVRVITDYELSIGTDIPDDGILAYIVTSEPENACSEIKPPPKDPLLEIGNDTRFSWFVLVDRDYCVMDKKLKNVKDAGYDGVIIYNARLTQLQLPELDYQLVVDFPVLLVTHIDGRQIKTYYTYEKGYFAKFFNNSPFHIYPFLVPFLVVIGACIIVIISFMISQIIRCYNERRKRRRHRLAKRHLRKIPTINFKKGDHYEICAICLDEFQEGVKLRLLTCGHAYHLKCIDPWLTENRRTCPICKGKVVVPGMTDSESENDAEAEHNATERTPLLAGSSAGQQSNDNLVYSNNLIFPIGRRTRRSGRSSAAQSMPSTSGILNNDELAINPQVTTQSTTTSIPPEYRDRRRRRDRNPFRTCISVEINSPQSNVNDEHASTIRIEDDAITDDQSTSTFRSAANADVSNNPNTTIDTSTANQSIQHSSSASQQPSSNSNHGTANQSRSSRRDNIV